RCPSGSDSLDGQDRTTRDSDTLCIEGSWAAVVDIHPVYAAVSVVHRVEEFVAVVTRMPELDDHGFPPPAPTRRRAWCRVCSSGTRPSARCASAFGHDSHPRQNSLVI